MYLKGTERYIKFSYISLTATLDVFKQYTAGNTRKNSKV
ncbi:conserved hypothetical protein [Clostridium botulinum Bf]|nr:conserved hypothetical protein [Clostridium botulinum Bf]